MFQTKEQNNTLQKKTLNKTEISNLPDEEFKIMVIKMLTKLCRGMDEQRKSKKVPNRSHRAKEYNRRRETRWRSRRI